MHKQECLWAHIYGHTYLQTWKINVDTCFIHRYHPTTSFSLDNISWKFFHVSDEYKGFHLNISLYCLKWFHVKLFHAHTSYLPSQKENGNSSRAGVLRYSFSFLFLYSTLLHLLHISHISYLCYGKSKMFASPTPRELGSSG